MKVPDLKCIQKPGVGLV